MKFYKIYNVDTGLYSTGGYYPQFEKIGKRWTNKTGVSNHIRLAEHSYKNKNIEIIEIELQEINKQTYTFDEWLKGMNDRKRNAR